MKGNIGEHINRDKTHKEFTSSRGRNTHFNIFDSFSYNNHLTKIFHWIERSCLIFL